MIEQKIDNRKAAPGQLLIRVNAFNIDTYGLALTGKSDFPVLACAGEIADSSVGHFQKGQRVIAVAEMNMGCSEWDAPEYIAVPASLVFAANSELSFRELAAIPDSFLSVWCTLFKNMKLSADDILLVRGAERAAGDAAIQIAKALGCKVVATTSRALKMSLLTMADAAVLDIGSLDRAMSGVTKVIDLRDDGVFIDMLTDLPAQETVDEMFRFMREHELHPKIEKLFDLADMDEAIEVRNGGRIDGKIIVVNYDDEDEETTNWLNDLADLFG